MTTTALHKPQPPLWALCSKAHVHTSACALKVSECATCGATIHAIDGRWQHAEEPATPPTIDRCTCLYSCADDPAEGCSLSGDWHVHPQDSRGVTGACPVHPDAPGDPRSRDPVNSQADFPTGSAVTYRPYPGAPPEDGLVTGWSNDPSLVFVRYDWQHPAANGQATPVIALERAR